jgi:hypothetical protein
MTIEWLRTVPYSASELCVTDAPALQEAKDFLREHLAEGPISVKETKAEASMIDISDRTLRRAREALGIRAIRLPLGGSYVWELPEDSETTIDQSK